MFYFLLNETYPTSIKLSLRKFEPYLGRDFVLTLNDCPFSLEGMGSWEPGDFEALEYTAEHIGVDHPWGYFHPCEPRIQSSRHCRFRSDCATHLPWGALVVASVTGY